MNAAPSRPFASILLLVLSAVASAWALAESDASRVAIVIDDIGYQWTLDRRALDLNDRIAVSILAESPHASTLARRAESQGREIWIHLPLAGLRTDNCQAGLTCLEPDWSPDRMRTHLLGQLDLVPGAIGINNHQGSRFTADRDAVMRLVDAIEQINFERGQHLIVLDSRTVADSKLEQVARAEGLSTLRRRVFLDHRNDRNAIANAWQDLIDLARYHGEAVAIAHPRPLTMEFLESAVETLAEQGIELVPPSRLASPAKRAVELPLAP